MEQKYASLALHLLTVVLLAVVAFQLTGIAKGIDTSNSNSIVEQGYLQAICRNTLPQSADAYQVGQCGQVFGR